MQEFLNADDDCLWGIVSNGSKLRVLRDNPSLTRPGLHRGRPRPHVRRRPLSGFRRILARRPCHPLQADRTASRPVASSRVGASRLTRPASASLDNLRDGVTDALRQLGNGLLQYPDNDGPAIRAARGSPHPGHVFRPTPSAGLSHALPVHGRRARICSMRRMPRNEQRRGLCAGIFTLAPAGARASPTILRSACGYLGESSDHVPRPQLAALQELGLPASGRAVPLRPVSRSRPCGHCERAAVGRGAQPRVLPLATRHWRASTTATWARRNWARSTRACWNCSRSST